MTDDELLQEIGRYARDASIWNEEKKWNFFNKLRSRLKELIEIEKQYEGICK